MKKLILIFSIILFSMPAYAFGVRSFMEKCLNSWVGYPLDSLISIWGYPSSEKEIANKHLYIWAWARNGYIPQTYNTNGYLNYGNYNAVTTSYGGYNVTYYCNRIIEVDSDKNIIGWQWEGNKCPGSYFRGKSWVNPKNNEWARKKTEKKRPNQ